MRSLSTFDLNQVSGGQYFYPEDSYIIGDLQHRMAKQDGKTAAALGTAIAVVGCMYFSAPISVTLLTAAAVSGWSYSFGYSYSDAWNI